MCFLRFSKRKDVGDSELYYFKDKGSIKITSKFEALYRTLLSGGNRLNFDKICIFHKHVRPTCGGGRKFVTKKLQKQISLIWFHIFYMLIKRSLQKNYERN